MTPQQYAAWISGGSFGRDKAARQQATAASLRIQLQSEGWDDQMIDSHLKAIERAQNNTGTPQAPCPARQAYLEWLNQNS